MNATIKDRVRAIKEGLYMLRVEITQDYNDFIRYKKLPKANANIIAKMKISLANKKAAYKQILDMIKGLEHAHAVEVATAGYMGKVYERRYQDYRKSREFKKVPKTINIKPQLEEIRILQRKLLKGRS